MRPRATGRGTLNLRCPECGAPAILVARPIVNRIDVLPAPRTNSLLQHSMRPLREQVTRMWALGTVMGVSGGACLWAARAGSPQSGR